MEFIDWLSGVKLSTYVDIALMALLIYVVLIWFKSTRAAFVFTGIVIAVIVYILVQQFELVMTTAVLQKFFAVILIALVVIFQEELRSFFERLALWSFDPRAMRLKQLRLSRTEVDILARSLQDMARKRIGALIILKGRDPIARHCEGGIELDGKISEQLLVSLFDPNSIGHDGAAIIEGGRLTEFSCHLPLSKNLSKIKRAGTRHAAALGLSELSDAMCIVVSEERGTISLARNGDIETVIDPSRLTYILQRFFQEVYPSRESRSWYDVFFRNLREKLLALGLSVALWFTLVRGSEPTTQSFTIPITVPELPAAWELRSLNPDKVTATFNGPRNAFFWLKENQLRAVVSPEIKTGLQYVPLTSNQIQYSKNLVLQNLSTNEVRVRLVNRNESAGNNQATSSP